MANPITRQHVTGGVAGGAVGSVAAFALAAVLIPHWEGQDLRAKHNSFDPAGVITVCDGVTNYDWPWLKAGMTFTKEECQKALVDEIPKYAEPIAKCVPDFPTYPPHRWAALVSFSYNLGPARICNGPVGRALNAHDYVAACNLMTQYVRANGVVLPGLKNRRYDPVWGERAWCLRND